MGIDRYFEARDKEWKYSSIQYEKKIKKLISALIRANQTLLNLSYGELSGEAKQIALNEATNIRKLIDELG